MDMEDPFKATDEIRKNTILKNMPQKYWHTVLISLEKMCQNYEKSEKKFTFFTFNSPVLILPIGIPALNNPPEPDV